MTRKAFRPGPRRLLLGVSVSVYLLFLLEPTAWLFYELYHLSGIGVIYYFYSGFRTAGVYFGQWAYQWPVCLAIGVLTALPWWNYLKAKVGGKA